MWCSQGDHGACNEAEWGVGEGCLGDMLKLLENSLDCYEKVIFFEIEELILVLAQLKRLCVANRKILVLSAGPCLPGFRRFSRAACRRMPVRKVCVKGSLKRYGIAFRQIPKETARQMKELYFTYEFSDKFLWVSSDSTSYGNLYHMVEGGLLTLEEFAAALLG